MKTQAIITHPDGRVEEKEVDFAGFSRDEIDLFGSLMAQRYIDQGLQPKEAMDKAAKWSEENEALIDDAIALGKEGSAVVDYVNAIADHDRKEPRPQGSGPVKTSKPWTEEDIKNYYAGFGSDEPETRNPKPETIVSIDEIPSYHEARTLAFALHSHPEILTHLCPEERIAVACVITDDFKLASEAMYHLNYPEKPDHALDIESEDRI